MKKLGDIVEWCGYNFLFFILNPLLYLYTIVTIKDSINGNNLCSFVSSSMMNAASGNKLYFFVSSMMNAASIRS